MMVKRCLSNFFYHFYHSLQQNLGFRGHDIAFEDNDYKKFEMFIKHFLL